MLKGFASRGNPSASLGKFSASLNGTWGRQFLPWIFAGFIGLLIADVAIIYARSLMLPTTQVPPRPSQPIQYNAVQRGSLDTIRGRNIFSAKNIVPDPLSAPDGSEQQQDLPPVLSSLPLVLIGTLVHSNPDKSMASIDVKNKNQVLSFSPKDEIEGMAKVESIERGKVFFRNSSSGRMEYIELKMDSKVNFGASTTPTPTAGTGSKEVKQVGQNQYEIKREDLMKYTNDLSSVLMQARAVPAKRPGSGEIYGFRILEIQPGSIFSQFGLLPMDVITGVNGNPVTNVQQAMEFYAAMKGADKIKIGVERNGRVENLDYTISK